MVGINVHVRPNARRPAPIAVQLERWLLTGFAPAEAQCRNTTHAVGRIDSSIRCDVAALSRIELRRIGGARSSQAPAATSMDCCRWRSQHGVRHWLTTDAMRVAGCPRNRRLRVPKAARHRLARISPAPVSRPSPVIRGQLPLTPRHAHWSLACSDRGPRARGLSATHPSRSLPRQCMFRADTPCDERLIPCGLGVTEHYKTAIMKIPRLGMHPEHAFRVWLASHGRLGGAGPTFRGEL